MKVESDKYTVRQVTANRELVDTLLANNKGNRPISKGRVAQLVRDIRAGNWQPNGSTITVDADGNLMDGQHRLMAIREAGYPRYITLILVQLKVRGEEREEVYVTMNSGRTNSAAQIFAHNGIKDGNCKTAIARQLVLLGSDMDLAVIPTRAELVKAYNAYEGEVDKAAGLKYSSPAIRFQASALAAFAAAAVGQRNPQKVWDFARDVGLGANLVPGKAGHRLFVYCNAAGGKHVSSQSQVEMFTRTLNAVYHHLDNPDGQITSLRLTAAKSRLLWRRAQTEAERRGRGFSLNSEWNAKK